MFRNGGVSGMKYVQRALLSLALAMNVFVPAAEAQDYWNVSIFLPEQSYTAVVQNKISKNWHPPKDAQVVSVSVLFEVKADGKIAWLKTGLPSASQLHNKLALQAVRSAAPLLSTLPATPP